ncbi:5-bromo-4-chloroindolyl phosphate hydrolysis family protein [Jannaschia sp. W003]|uniref:5-bromo-4-chloroindolyl phosphate hydrolysis family protein n=1 Tax=Jannaschia sp. W003 TaxID=2867012 RepID=UPI0021A873A2|nr:5-bromo-4-chloroindolyl phosphate hydrolysis family protein [Jannaschia sp. W003]UWQ20761.1 5-bromo-4-chloroindolyl phosphate hydrolysis family protein [Jannaschia sp. W003]
MARRYGGAFSPRPSQNGAEAPPPPALGRPLRGRARTTILMALAAIPVATAFAQGSATALAVNLLAGGALFAAGVLTREGLKAEAAWAERKVARRPAWPRKMFGAALSGVGVTLAAMTGLDGIGPALIYGIVAAALHVAAFGLDPMRDKGMEGVDRLQTDRAARSVEEGRRLLAQMRDAVLRARDREALEATERFAAKAEAMFRTVEDDPRDLTAARKYLGVYLMGARDAAAKFADIHAARPDAQAKSDYLALLGELEQGFDAKRERLLLADRTDLEVEIETLKDRLRRDGLPTEG